MGKEAFVAFETLAIVLTGVPARGVVDHRTLGVALLAESLRIHDAYFLGIC